MAELEYHPGASDEVAYAYDDYSAIDPDLGVRFKLELDRAEGLVQWSPETWSRYFHDTQGFRFRGFPFVMTYVIRGDRIIVIALAHTRRRPGYWPDRLDD